MARSTLTRESIVDACLLLVEVEGEDRLTLRRLGDALGADPTAIYRHFRDKDELMRAIADRIHGTVLVDLPDGPWDEVVREVCIRLRRAHLDRPALAAHVRTGPPLHDNEFALTEVILRRLVEGGLSDRDAALGYHALVELTVGSAALDAPMAALDPDERVARYGAWRRTYAALDESVFPTSVVLSPHLYDGSADARFVFALDTLLTGLSARAGDPDRAL
jgi:TetR/AcrR family transcriptional regulator, tetracycline repressor protein